MAADPQLTYYGDAGLETGLRLSEVVACHVSTSIRHEKEAATLWEAIAQMSQLRILEFNNEIGSERRTLKDQYDWKGVAWERVKWPLKLVAVVVGDHIYESYWPMLRQLLRHTRLCSIALRWTHLRTPEYVQEFIGLCAAMPSLRAMQLRVSAGNEWPLTILERVPQLTTLELDCHEVQPTLDEWKSIGDPRRRLTAFTWSLASATPSKVFCQCWATDPTSWTSLTRLELSWNREHHQTRDMTQLFQALQATERYRPNLRVLVIDACWLPDRFYPLQFIETLSIGVEFFDGESVSVYDPSDRANLDRFLQSYPALRTLYWVDHKDVRSVLASYESDDALTRAADYMTAQRSGKLRVYTYAPPAMLDDFVATHTHTWTHHQHEQAWAAEPRRPPVSSPTPPPAASMHDEDEIKVQSPSRPTTMPLILPLVSAERLTDLLTNPERRSRVDEWLMRLYGDVTEFTPSSMAEFLKLPTEEVKHALPQSLQHSQVVMAAVALYVLGIPPKEMKASIKRDGLQPWTAPIVQFMVHWTPPPPMLTLEEPADGVTRRWVPPDRAELSPPRTWKAAKWAHASNGATFRETHDTVWKFLTFPAKDDTLAWKHRRKFIQEWLALNELQSTRLVPVLKREYCFLNAAAACIATGHLAEHGYIPLSRLRDLPMTELAQNALGRALFQALFTIHRAGWYHGDPHRWNVFIKIRSFDIQFLDWGLSLSARDQTRLVASLGDIPNSQRILTSAKAYDVAYLGHELVQLIDPCVDTKTRYVAAESFLAEAHRAYDASSDWVGAEYLQAAVFRCEPSLFGSHKPGASFSEVYGVPRRTILGSRRHIFDDQYELFLPSLTRYPPLTPIEPRHPEERTSLRELHCEYVEQYPREALNDRVLKELDCKHLERLAELILTQYSKEDLARRPHQTEEQHVTRLRTKLTYGVFHAVSPRSRNVLRWIRYDTAPPVSTPSWHDDEFHNVTTAQGTSRMRHILNFMTTRPERHLGHGRDGHVLEYYGENRRHLAVKSYALRLPKDKISAEDRAYLYDHKIDESMTWYLGSSGSIRTSRGAWECEIRALKRLGGVEYGFPTYYGACRDGADAKIIMSFAPGHILRHSLDLCTLHDRQRSLCTEWFQRALALRLCAQIEFMHTRGIIHGDLGPSNVMWSWEGGQLTIFDFSRSFTVNEEKACREWIAGFGKPPADVTMPEWTGCELDYMLLAAAFTECYMFYAAAEMLNAAFTGPSRHRKRLAAETLTFSRSAVQEQTAFWLTAMARFQWQQCRRR